MHYVLAVVGAPRVLCCHECVCSAKVGLFRARETVAHMQVLSHMSMVSDGAPLLEGSAQ